MVTTDLAHGGRWTSLVVGGREWLWHRPDPARFTVRPGDAFVDAGGLEECLPTIRGVPDHGGLWSRPWSPAGGAGAGAAGGVRAGAAGGVEADGFTLARTIRDESGKVVADYRLTGEPGRPFLWAAHALLDLSAAARLDAPGGTGVRVYDTGVEPWADMVWPLPLAELGPADGTAAGAILTGCPSVTVADGPDRLTFTLTAGGQPVSTAVWRNLGGFGGYRSIGVEPMLGRVFDLATAGPGDAAIIPASGICEWRLEIR
jgi:hypothetical protein